MLCPQCGTQVEKNFQYCPSCGARLEPSSVVSPNEEAPLQSQQKKRMPLWFKIVSFLAVLALIGVTAGILFTESLVDVVDKQLAALKEEDVAQAYYGYTSTDFQAATSLDQFRDFIQAYPILTHSQSASFPQRSMQQNIGTLKGTLTSADHLSFPVEYKLVKEDGKWKILSIRLLQTGSREFYDDPSQLQEVIQVVKNQMQAIENGQIASAYQKYTSQEFKEATSPQAFETFINKYPILSKHQSVTLHKPSQKNGLYTLSAILQSDQWAAYLKYYLVYEEGSWKISSLRILSPMEGEQERESHSLTQRSSNNGEMQVSAIQLGEEIDENGVIQKPSLHFKSASGDLYVNVEVQNGKKGELLDVQFKHLNSQSVISNQAFLQEDGDTSLMFVFSPPPKGWPKGKYTLIVSSDSGLNGTTDFDIE